MAAEYDEENEDFLKKCGFDFRGVDKDMILNTDKDETLEPHYKITKEVMWHKRPKELLWEDRIKNGKETRL